MKKIEIFTDGACSGNPGPGGWGAVMRYEDRERELSAGSPDTTNNRMELIAVIEALKTLNQSCEATIYTDSQYVKKGVDEWMAGWKKNGWRTSAKSAVKNQDLWQALDQALASHRTEFVWVKGHAGHAENERADALARAAIPR